MKFNLVSFEDYPYTDKFLNFCQDASQEITQPAATNMWSPTWETDPHTLPYKLLVNKTYAKPQGVFYLVLDNNDIIACGGAYQSEFCSDLLIAGVRTWVSKKYRNLSISREYLLPCQKKFASDNNYKAIALSFNDYNKNIIKIWKRNRLGENRSPRQPYHMFYNNFQMVDFPVEIQYTAQWVIYEKLDINFNFEWKNIQCK
jgi:hypothetical protein